MIEIKARNNTGKNRIAAIDSDMVFTPIVDGQEVSSVGETPEIAMLIGIGYKYDGPNSQFAKMACRMLNIESIWAK